MNPKNILHGKLIVLYGINNLGKTTQAKLLVKKLQGLGLRAEYLKYPIYELKPTGPKINQILRSGNKQNISEEEFQNLYAQNRRDYEPMVKKKLGEGISIVAEDYIGTGIAWGVSKGADLNILEKQNQDLLSEDIAILLDGERFLEGKESNHLHESNDSLMQRCRQIHKDLAKKYKWYIINANQPIDSVHQDIIKIIQKTLHLS